MTKRQFVSFSPRFSKSLSTSNYMFGVLVMAVAAAMFCVPGPARSSDITDVLRKSAAEAKKNSPQVSRVTILVTDSDCVPLSGAALDIAAAKQPGLRAKAVSGPDGLVKFNISPGQFKVTAAAAGFDDGQAFLVASVGEVSVEIAMRRAGKR